MTAGEDSVAPCWHQALAYAVTGHRSPELGHQQAPDLPVLVAWLRAPTADRPREATTGAPYAVPDDLLAGISRAQFWAVLSRLRSELSPTVISARPVLADRPLTADERRLLSDVPPHHV